MFSVDTKSPVRLFYERWNSSVFTFCLLLTGNKMRAEESATKAFIEYVRHNDDLAPSELPAILLRFAFEATQESFAPVPLEHRLKFLQHAIFSLPLDQRTTFVIRHVLGLSQDVVSAVLGIDLENVRTLELAALLRLRDCLPKDFFQRGRNEC